MNGDRIMRELENESGTEINFYLYDREDRIADYDPSDNLLIAYTHGPGTAFFSGVVYGPLLSSASRMSLPIVLPEIMRWAV